MIRINKEKEENLFIYNIWATSLFQCGKMQGMGLSRRQIGIEIRLDLEQELWETVR